jgi:hypothetical protein
VGVDYEYGNSVHNEFYSEGNDAIEWCGLSIDPIERKILDGFGVSLRKVPNTNCPEFLAERASCTPRRRRTPGPGEFNETLRPVVKLGRLPERIAYI